jgi:hypothetical protein
MTSTFKLGRADRAAAAARCLRSLVPRAIRGGVPPGLARLAGPSCRRPSVTPTPHRPSRARVVQGAELPRHLILRGGLFLNGGTPAIRPQLWVPCPA